MTYQSSYKVDAVALNTKNEINRLEAQVELFWEKELAIYKTCGLVDGMSIVECGCGTGIVGRKLMREYPECRITAFDIDSLLVEEAKNSSQLFGLENYDIFEAPINRTGLPENNYDFAITRLVLEHLTNPDEAVKEVFRILKPNGKAVFIDNDFEFHLRTWPDIPELKDLYDAYCQARKDEGGNPKIGRELPNLLVRSGFTNIDLQIISAHSCIVGDLKFLKSEGSGIPAKLVKDGYLAGEIYTIIAEKWNALLKTDGHSLFRQLFFCIGQKTFKDSVINLHIKKLPSNPEYREFSKKDPIEKEYIGKEEAREIDLSTSAVSIEKRITKIWCKVLNREDIEADENFFEAGGSSLYALEIIELLQKDFKKDISIVELFENPTISLLAKLLKNERQKKIDLTPDQRKGERLRKITERRDAVKKLRQIQVDNR